MVQAIQYETGTIEKPLTVGVNSRIRTRALKIGGHCEIGDNVHISADQLLIGRDTKIQSDVVIKGKRVQLGRNVRILPRANILSHRIAIHENTEIGENVRITAHEEFSIGRVGVIAKNARLCARSIEIGDFFYSDENPIPMIIGGGGWRRPSAVVRIGSGCVIHDSFINACMPVEIGDDVGFSAGSAIITHGFWNSVIAGYRTKFGPVKIGKNVIIGYRAIILPGVTVGDYCSIGAGAVVTKSFPANCVVAGVPAKIVEARPGYPRHMTLKGRTRTMEELLEEYALLLGDKLDQVVLSREKEHVTIIRSKCLSKKFEILFSPSFRARPHGKKIRRILLSFEDVPVSDGDFGINLTKRTWRGSDDDVSDDLRDFLRHYGIRVLSRRFRSMPSKLERQLADM
jgi:acetyltransferase-like isoleucine patch superfamily enzyme